MKRILFLMAMLIGVVYGQAQSIGYLRYDSVRIQKIGGNGELIIENGTRNVTGGVLTNIGNGRTGFVLPSSSGGLGGGNLGSGFRYYVPGSSGVKTAFGNYGITIDSTTNANALTYRLDSTTVFPQIRATIPPATSTDDLDNVAKRDNYTDTLLKSAGFQANDTYGLIWSDPFTGGSLGSNYVDASSSTETFTGNGLELDGTANVYTNAYYRTDSTSEQNTTNYLRFQVKEVSADSYGVLIGFGNLNSLCCDHHWYGGVSLTNGTKTLRIETEGSGYIYNDATALTIAVNDTIEIWTVFEGWNMTVKYYNQTTKVRHSFTLTGVPQGSVLPSTPKGFGRSALVHLGGNILIQNWSRYSDESRSAKNLWIGPSLIAPGGNLTDPSQRLPYLVSKGNKSDAIIYGGGGSTLWMNRAGIPLDFPRYANVENVWLMGGGNDTLFSVWGAQGQESYRRIRNYWVAQGKRVIHVIETPRDAVPIGAIATWITTEFPTDATVNLYDRYRNGGTVFPAPWDAGDGTHWTKEMNRDGARYIDSLYPQYAARNLTGEVNGYYAKFKSLALTGVYEWDYTATAQTATIPNDASLVYINPSSTLATLTIQLPYQVDSGKVMLIKFGGTLTTGVVVTALTMAVDASQTMVRSGFVNYNNAVNAFGVGDWIFATYKGQNRWDLNPVQTFAYTDATINGHGIGRGNLQTQQDNLRVGYFAGHSWAAGSSDNVAIGPSAQQGGTTGVRNTAIGNEAMMNRSGASSNNTAVGEEALRNGASGSGQTAVGHATGFAATGANITIMGINAGFDLSSGGENTFYGNSAGRGVTTGAGNTIIGDNMNGWAAAQAGTVGVGANGLRRWYSSSSGRNRFGGSLANDTTATAWLHLSAGAAAANYAPLKFTTGIVNTTPEAGAVEYNNAFYATTNAVNRIGIGGVIAGSSSTVSNSGSSATTLVTYTTKANTLAATDEMIRAEIHGTFDEATMTATMTMTFAGTTILNITPAGNPTGWKIICKVIRTGASTATAFVDFYNDQQFNNSVTTHLTGLTFSNTNALVLTGTSSIGGSDDIVREAYRVYWEPAPNN